MQALELKLLGRKRERLEVLGEILKVGDVVMRGGFEWVIHEIRHEQHQSKNGGPKTWRYSCHCHWSGNLANPNFFSNDFETAQRDDLPWTRVLNARPRRLICRTKALAWYATRYGGSVELRRPFQCGAGMQVKPSDEILASIRPPKHWGNKWDWNLLDTGDGVLLEQTGK